MTRSKNKKQKATQAAAPPSAQNHNEKKTDDEGIQDSRSQNSQKKAKLSFADKIRNALACFFARAPSR